MTTYGVGSVSKAGVQVPCPFCVLCRHNQQQCSILVKVKKGEMPMCRYVGPVDQEVIEAYINLALYARSSDRIKVNHVANLVSAEYQCSITHLKRDIFEISFHALKDNHCSTA
jgi:hypothetical protein